MSFPCEPFIFTSVAGNINGYKLAYSGVALDRGDDYRPWLVGKIEELITCRPMDGATAYQTYRGLGFLFKVLKLERDWAGRSGIYVTGLSFQLADSGAIVPGIHTPNWESALLTHEEFLHSLEQDGNVSREAPGRTLETSAEVVSKEDLASPTFLDGVCVNIAYLRLVGGKQVVVPTIDASLLRGVAFLCPPGVRPHLTYLLGGSGVPLVGCTIQQHCRRPKHLVATSTWMEYNKDVLTPVEDIKIAFSTLLDQQRAGGDADALAEHAEGCLPEDGVIRRVRLYNAKNLPQSFVELADRFDEQFLEAITEVKAATGGRYSIWRENLVHDCQSAPKSLASVVDHCFQKKWDICADILETTRHCVVKRLSDGDALSQFVQASASLAWHEILLEAVRVCRDPKLGEEMASVLLARPDSIRERWLSVLLRRAPELATQEQWRNVLERSTAPQVWGLLKDAVLANEGMQWAWANPSFVGALSTGDILTNAGNRIPDKILAQWLRERAPSFAESDAELVRGILSNEPLINSRRCLLEAITRNAPPEMQLAICRVMLDDTDAFDWNKIIELAPSCSTHFTPGDFLSVIWYLERSKRLSGESAHRIGMLRRSIKVGPIADALLSLEGLVQRIVEFSDRSQLCHRLPLGQRVANVVQGHQRRESRRRLAMLDDTIWREYHKLVAERKALSEETKMSLGLRLYDYSVKGGYPSARPAIGYIVLAMADGILEHSDVAVALSKLNLVATLTRTDRSTIESVIEWLVTLEAIGVGAKRWI